MTLREPASMNECVYFTNRTIGTGKVRAWVFRSMCPQCGKGLMSKPRDQKTEKIKIRAHEYVCPSCHYTISEEVYEESLAVSIQYTCPSCGHEGEIEIPFKRKKIQIFDEEETKKKTADALRFQCEHCGKTIAITKKMK